ncbi:MAG: autotransporter outer membrane beta-barrel domain-containing protein, partial [Bacteroidota bacterium]
MNSRTILNIRYMVAMMVMVIISINASSAQTNKKKTGAKPKTEKASIDKKDSTAKVNDAISKDTLAKLTPVNNPKKGNDKNEKKSAKDEEVELIRPYQPNLSEGYKISNSPQIEQAKMEIPKMDFSINAKAMPTWYDVLPITATKMKEEKPEPLSNIIIKLGYGNYNNVFGELYLNNDRSKEYSYGAHIKHFSSDGQLSGVGFNGFSDNQISIYGKRYLDNETISGGLDYNRNVVHYYGYAAPDSLLNKDNTKHVFNSFGVNVGFQSNFVDKMKLQHDATLNFYTLGDNFNGSETGISLKGMIKQKLGNGQSVGGTVLLDYSGLKQDTFTNKANTIFGIAPQYSFKQGDFDIALGVNAEMESYVKSKAYLYPNIDINYNVTSASLVVYAAFKGETIKNTFKTITAENPFTSTPLASFGNTNI